MPLNTARYIQNVNKFLAQTREAIYQNLQFYKKKTASILIKYKSPK